MNLLYLTFIDIGDPKQLGIFKKVKGQINAFENELSRVFYTTYNNGELEFCEKNYCIKVIKISNRLISKLLRMRAYYPKIISLIESNNIDIIYIRYFLSDPFFLYFIRKCSKKGIKVLIEVPTYPYALEVENSVKKIVDNMSTKLFKNYVNRIVTFSNDNEIFSVKAININNGIDMSNITPKKNGPINAIHLIGVANVSRWHGYDKVILGLKNYYCNKHTNKVYFNIVGEGEELEKLIRLVDKLDLNEYVIFHGSKSGDQLDEIFDHCHIGIGSLANHRKGLTSESALKNREYCAKGIPFILASEDLDFPDYLKYVYRVERNEAPLDIQSVVEFYWRVYDDGIINSMRDFAKDNLSWDRKLLEVIKYCNE